MFNRNRTTDALPLVKDQAVPLAGVGGVAGDEAVPREALDAVVNAVGDARLVLLGEATHGTAEFYAIREALTLRLIEEKGFAAAVVEADWPDAYRVNRYIRQMADGETADEALGGFERFPQWMWRNTVVLRMADRLRELSATCGFYGMDLYSLHASAEAVLQYLETIDPDAAERARRRYECFAHFLDPSDYGMAASLNMEKSCQDKVIEQLTEMLRGAAELAARDGRLPQDEHFYARQNARLVANAERYYRSMFERGVNSWNVRDTHMADTVDAIATHLGQGRPAKLVLWAHNSHLGDASATEIGDRGEINVGQILRERHSSDVFNLGFTTHDGTVTAANNWGGDARHKRINPSLKGSVERLMHDATGDVGPNFFLDLREPELQTALDEPLLERAIGVIYRPQTERQSHYFHAHVAGQFDALVHIDRTTALEPLERSAMWEPDRAETFPSGV